MFVKLSIYDIFVILTFYAPVNIKIVSMMQNVKKWLACVWNSGWQKDCYISSTIVSVHIGFCPSMVGVLHDGHSLSDRREVR